MMRVYPVLGVGVSKVLWLLAMIYIPMMFGIKVKIFSLTSGC